MHFDGDRIAINFFFQACEESAASFKLDLQISESFLKNWGGFLFLGMKTGGKSEKLFLLGIDFEAVIQKTTLHR